MTHAEILAIADPIVSHARACITCRTAPTDARLCSRGQDLKYLALALIDTPEPVEPEKRCACYLCSRCSGITKDRNLICDQCAQLCFI